MGSQPYTEEEWAEIKKAGEVLSYKLSIWKRHGNGKILIKGSIMDRSQSSFAMLLYPDSKKPQSRVSKWILGHSRIPSDKLDEIVSIFSNDGISTTKEEFRIHSEEEYKYNTEVINRWIEDHYLWRKSLPHNDLKTIQLFLRFLKTIPEYDDLFPLWTPIVLNELHLTDEEKLDAEDQWNASIGSDYPIFKRDSYKNLPDAAPSDYPEFQVDKGKDGVKTLQEADIYFIRKLISEVIFQIKHLLRKHKQELDEIASDASSSLYALDYLDLECAARDELIQEQKDLYKNDYLSLKREMMLIDPNYFYYYASKAEDDPEYYMTRNDKTFLGETDNEPKDDTKKESSELLISEKEGDEK